MIFKLSTDCLNEIIEYFEEDKITLHSCLLVNRFWCRISVRILWRNIWNYEYNIIYQHETRVATSILSTLIACLPNESKDTLYKNDILISTPTPNPPLFNYPAFCKVFSINGIYKTTRIGLQFFDDNQIYIALKEIIKMFITQISSLKKLIYYDYYNIFLNNISFPHLPDYFIDLLELRCNSNIHSEFFYQLSQTCHNLKSLTIEFENKVSNMLKELISLQKNLKQLNLFIYEENNWINIIPSLAKHSNTMTKFHIYGDNYSLSLSFISSFSNLQDIKFSYIDENFKELQYVKFPKLQILKILYQCFKPEYVIKFLEINGNNLKECYFGEGNNSLNLSIAKFCPNIKKLFVEFSNNELDILITILNSCQYLESIGSWFGSGALSEKQILESITKYSSKYFYELKIYNFSSSELIPEDLETFFLDWENRTPKKPINLIIFRSIYKNLDSNKENMKIIEDYKNLSIIKKFEIREITDIEFEEDLDYY
ncbi:hypothetical protein C1645_825601 [Glomus cerebriforme]|uniref:F-box domain-containing protein n=1 Tax=Glomus cerebriforme TaxID=658196 RepID=A0A397T180_9GLOM|nr:hypothetical protein C1645_825601 [Glomus cerebriforme]